MNGLAGGVGRLIVSAALSVALSTAATFLLKAIITAAIQKGEGSPEAAPGPHRPGPGRGANINPVAVFVFMPILVGNSSNAFGPSRSFVGSRKKKKR